MSVSRALGTCFSLFLFYSTRNSTCRSNTSTTTNATSTGPHVASTPPTPIVLLMQGHEDMTTGARDMAGAVFFLLSTFPICSCLYRLLIYNYDNGVCVPCDYHRQDQGSRRICLSSPVCFSFIAQRRGGSR